MSLSNKCPGVIHATVTVLENNMIVVLVERATEQERTEETKYQSLVMYVTEQDK